MLFVILTASILFGFCHSITFPTTDLTCPTYDKFYGGSSQITALHFQQNTPFFLSGDSAGILMLSDMRDGKVLSMSTTIASSSYIYSISFYSSSIVQLVTYTSLVLVDLIKFSVTATPTNDLMTSDSYYYHAETIYDSTSSNSYGLSILLNPTSYLIAIQRVDSSQAIITMLQMVVDTTSVVVQPGKSIQPYLFFFAENVSGVAGLTTPVNVLFGIPSLTSEYIYAATFSSFDASSDSENWVPSSIPYVIVAYAHLKGSSKIAIQLGSAVQSSGGMQGSSSPTSTALQNCIVFYDMTLLTYTSGLSHALSLDAMIASPSSSSSRTGTDQIISMISFYFNKTVGYIAFMTQGNYLIVYGVSDFIANNYSFSTAIQITIKPVSLITAFSSINLDDSSKRLIVGFSSGQIQQIDFSSYISSSTTTNTSVTLDESFNFIQNNLSTSETITNLYVDQTNNSVYVIGESTTLMIVYYSKVNLTTHQVSKSTSISFGSVLSIKSIVLTSGVVLTAVNTQKSQYVALQSGSCPTNASPQDAIDILSFSVAITNIGSSPSLTAINLSSDYLSILSVSSLTRFTFDSNDYAALVVSVRSFISSNYCTYTQSGGGGGSTGGGPGVRFLETTTYGVLVLIVNSSGSIVAKSDSTQISLASSSESSVGVAIDSSGNVFVLMASYLKVIKLTSTTTDSVTSVTMTYFTVNSSEILSYVQLIDSTVLAIAEMLSISVTLSHLIIQFRQTSSSTTYYTAFIPYSWDSTNSILSISASAVTSSTKAADAQPYLITSAIYYQASDAYIFKIGAYYKIYSISTSFVLNLAIYDSNASSTTTYIFPYVVDSVPYLYVIQQTGVLGRFKLNGCLTASCLDSPCKVEPKIDQQSTSTFADIFISGTDSDSSNRVESLDVEMLKISELVTLLPSTSIDLAIGFEIGSVVTLKERYFDLEFYKDQSTYFNKNAMRLAIRSRDSSLSDPYSTSDVFYASYEGSFDIDHYTSIGLMNILWTNTKANTDYLFIQDSYSFILNNVQPNPASLTSSGCQLLEISYGTEGAIQNTKISSQSYQGISSLVQVNVSGYTLYMKYVEFTSCYFENTNLVFSEQAYTMYLYNSAFMENKVNLNNFTLSQSSYFIASQFLFLKNVTFTSNIFAETTLFGLSKSSSYTTIYSVDLHLKNTTFLLTDLSASSTALLFDAKKGSYLTTISTFQMINSTFYQTSQYGCGLTTYLSTKCAATTSSSSSSDSIVTVTTYNMIKLEYITISSLKNVTDIDNDQVFLSSEYTIYLTINRLTCGSTYERWISTSIDQSCIQLNEHTSPYLRITNSQIYNKKLYNTYALSISSASHTAGSGSYDGELILNTFSIFNTTVTTQNSYYQSSNIYIYSMAILDIQMIGVTIEGVTYSTPKRLFYKQASTFLIEAPFSSITFSTLSLSSFQSNSPQPIGYLNSNSVSITDSVFKNNNYDFDSGAFTGGFLVIESDKVSMLNTNFTKSLAITGSAITLTPSKVGAVYTFTSCYFSQLIASESGAAIYMGDSLDSVTMTFTKCRFEQLASTSGGAASIIYSTSSSSTLTSSSTIYEKQLLYPNITFDSCTSNQVFAVYGGFAFLSNSNATFIDFKSEENNPNIITTTDYDSNFYYFIDNISTVGAFLTLSGSFLSGTNMEISNHNFHYSKSSEISNTVFVVAQSSSMVNLTNSNFKSSYYQSNGFFNIDSSKFILKNTNFTAINTKELTTSRLLSTRSVTTEINSMYSALMIKSSSSFDIQESYFTDMICSNELCLGGAIVIFNSKGTMYHSTFARNTAYSDGGAISIVNLSGDTKFTAVKVVNNTSTNGFGGGISLLTNLITNNLTLDACIISGNTAQQGGGIFLDFLKTPSTTPPYLTYIQQSLISDNYALVSGGGIFYQGYSPSIDTATAIFNNTAKSSFGQNQFSYPQQLLFNAKESLATSSNFSYSIYTNADDEVIVYLPSQVSGTELPNLIFNLLDEQGDLIDASYLTSTTDSVSLVVSKETTLSTSNFEISSSIKEFSFDGQFNLTGLVLSGTPGTTVYLNLTSSIIKSSSSSYRLILMVQLRDCVRGEIFTSVKDSSNSNINYYHCTECAANTYSLEYPNLSNPVTECQKCNTHATCPGGDVLEVEAGYWRINDQSSDIIECVNGSQNCLGGSTNSTCSEGHTGPLCESCNIEQDYSNTGNFQCGSCGDHATNALKILGILTFYIVSAKVSVDGILEKILQMFDIKKKLGENVLEKAEENASILLKMILNYFQIIMVLTTFQISVPTMFNGTLTVIASPTTQILYSFECFFYSLSLEVNINRIYIQIISSLLLPMICLLIFYLSGIHLYRKKKHLRMLYLYTSYLYCLMYFQPSIFKDAIDVISCRNIGDKYYIRYNVTFECYTDEYIKWSLMFILPVIITIAFIIPVSLIYKVYKCKDSHIERKRFIFLTGEYRNEAWYWEFVKMNVKLAIMCCLTFYEYDIPNKILFIFFWVGFYGYLLMRIKPYKEITHNKIDILQTVVQVISIYLGFVAYQNADALLIWMIAILLIGVINVAFISWSLKLLTTAYLPLMKQTIEDIKLALVKIPFCKRYCFSKRSRNYYLKRRWINSIIMSLRLKNLINAWTGKFKVNNQHIFSILYGKETQQPSNKNPKNISISNNSKDIEIQNVDNFENQNPEEQADLEALPSNKQTIRKDKLDLYSNEDEIVDIDDEFPQEKRDSEQIDIHAIQVELQNMNKLLQLGTKNTRVPQENQKLKLFENSPIYSQGEQNNKADVYNYDSGQLINHQSDDHTPTSRSFFGNRKNHSQFQVISSTEIIFRPENNKEKSEVQSIEPSIHNSFQDHKE